MASDQRTTSGTVENLRALLAAGTPGPWAYRMGGIVQLTDSGQGYPLDYYPDSRDVITCDRDGDMIMSDPDASLIVAAVNALPGLLDEIERLRADNEALRIARRARERPTD